MVKILSMIAVVAMFTLTGCHFNRPTHGEKIGHIVKLAEEGFMCGTMEAQLVRGGLNGGSGVVGGAPFHFTVRKNDHELLSQVEAALENGTEVILTYDQPMFTSVCASAADSDAFATGIKPSIAAAKKAEVAAPAAP